MQTADGWTHITAKGRKRRSENTIDHSKNNPPSKTATLAKIQADFNGKLKIWQSSSCRKSIISILRRVQPDDGWNIRRAVCMGSGSFSRDNIECRRRSLWQFAVFVDLVRELLQHHTESGMEIDMLAQEPEFTDLDRKFLSDMGVEMLGGDEHVSGLGPAKDHLAHDTFLFEPFMDVSRQMAREILAADPALYIGSSMRGLLAKEGEIGLIATQFDQQHDKHQFPPFDEDPNALEGLGVYWKLESDNN